MRSPAAITRASLAPLLLLAATIAGCELVDVFTLEVAELAIAPADFQLRVGQQRQLAVTLTDESGRELTGWDVEWFSDDSRIASINQAGIIQGNNVGRIRITATAQEVTGEAFVTVFGGPVIGVSSTSLVFAASTGAAPPPPQLVDVTNNGTGALEDLRITSIAYGPGAPAGWLSATFLGAVAPTQIRIAVASATLAPGAYSASISILGNNNLNARSVRTAGTDSGSDPVAATIDVELIVSNATAREN